MCRELDVEVPEDDDEEDEDAIIERRRKQREALIQVIKQLLFDQKSFNNDENVDEDLPFGWTL